MDIKKYIGIKNEFIKSKKSDDYLKLMEAFKLCCCDGHIEILKLLWKESIENNYQIDIHDNDGEVFLFTCYSGNIEILKWLWEKSVEINSPINIHANNDFGFRISCTEGNLETSQFLWNLSKKLKQKINFRHQKDLMFIMTCENSHLEIAKWLCEICLYYEINIVNYEIKYNILSKNDLPNDYRNYNFNLYNDNENIDI